GGTLLVVADGHGGHEAAELAVIRLLDDHAEGWIDASPLAPRWSEGAREALGLVHQALVGRGTVGGNPEARTTLAAAVPRPGEALLGSASIGDSRVFLAEAARATALAQGGGSDPPAFLGSPALDAADLAARAVIGSGPLRGARALALATDGLS